MAGPAIHRRQVIDGFAQRLPATNLTTNELLASFQLLLGGDSPCSRHNDWSLSMLSSASSESDASALSSSSSSLDAVDAAKLWTGEAKLRGGTDASGSCASGSSWIRPPYMLLGGGHMDLLGLFRSWMVAWAARSAGVEAAGRMTVEAADQRQAGSASRLCIGALGRLVA